mmetsp:Transcript_51237/g.136770  ORF Transcript_51237/g.136770 Transcript_51237/m.136770 type:complete len:239 (-) Transcript_51237:27-743(-)
MVSARSVVLALCGPTLHALRVPQTIGAFHDVLPHNASADVRGEGPGQQFPDRKSEAVQRIIEVADATEDHVLSWPELEVFFSYPEHAFLRGIMDLFSDYDLDGSQNLDMTELQNLLEHYHDTPSPPTKGNDSDVASPSVTNTTTHVKVETEAQTQTQANGPPKSKKETAIQRLLAVADVDKDGVLSWGEVEHFLSSPEHAFLSDIQTQFLEYDADHNQNLNATELGNLISGAQTKRHA